MPRPRVIGVTGAIATGKSTVTAILAELGAQRIDADEVYAELVRPASPLLGRLREHFGGSVVAGDGTLDRRALGAIVFADPVKLRELDELTHPAVIAEVVAQIEASPAAVVAVEAVKLIESGLAARCDEVWLVVADPAVQRARLIARTGMPGEEADRRLAAQPDEAARRDRADHVIDNSGTRDALRATVERRWRQLGRGGA